MRILHFVACLVGYIVFVTAQPNHDGNDRVVAFYHVFRGPFNNTDYIVDEQISHMRRSGLLGKLI